MKANVTYKTQWIGGVYPATPPAPPKPRATTFQRLVEDALWAYPNGATAKVIGKSIGWSAEKTGDTLKRMMKAGIVTRQARKREFPGDCGWVWRKK